MKGLDSMNEWKKDVYSLGGLSKFLAICLTPLGLFLLIYYAYSLMHVKAAYSWPTTEGRIIDSRVDAVLTWHDESKGRGVYSGITYEYSVNGETYRDWEKIGWYHSVTDARTALSQYLATTNSKIIFHYDPLNPKFSIIDTKTATETPSAYVSEWLLFSGIMSFSVGFICMLNLFGLADMDLFGYLKNKFQSKQFH